MHVVRTYCCGLDETMYELFFCSFVDLFVDPGLEDLRSGDVDSLGMESTDDSDSSVSVQVSDNDSLYIPTPERPLPLKASCVDLPHKMVFMDLSQLDQFVDTINKLRGCKTPRCDGALIPINVNSLYPIMPNGISALFYDKTYFWHTRRTAIAQILQ